MTDLHGMTLPTCEICVNGQKRKLYGKNRNKVYLHNGDNFQLKFFNPLQERIGVQLCMNGSKIDNDLLVINPGQEITIERYIGTNRKLTFSAYEIDTSKMSEERIKEAKKAIEKNGVLEVVFWNEKKSAPIIFTTTTATAPIYVPIIPNWQPNYDTSINFNMSGSSITNYTDYPTTITNTTSDIVINVNGTVDINNGQVIVKRQSGTSGSSGTSGTSGKSGVSGAKGSPGIGGTGGGGSNFVNYSSVDYAPQELYRGIVTSNMNGMGNIQQPLSRKIETGRIEKGGVSNQHFSPIAFEIGEPFLKLKFKLLPFSLKPVKKKLYDSTTIKNIVDSNTQLKNESSIREYCKCGYRVSRGKGGWDFCPKCGRKVK